MSIILGIDPGSRVTGYGIIHSHAKEVRYISSGCIRITSRQLSEGLQQIFDGIRDLMGEYHPDEVSVEEVFIHQNPRGALKLGQARGAAIVAAAIHAVPVAEYSPREIKQTVVGYGAATKDQVKHMVRYLLKLSGSLQTDASDALAVAICHALRQQSNLLTKIRELEEQQR